MAASSPGQICASLLYKSPRNPPDALVLSYCFHSSILLASTPLFHMYLSITASLPSAGSRPNISAGKPSHLIVNLLGLDTTAPSPAICCPAAALPENIASSGCGVRPFVFSVRLFTKPNLLLSAMLLNQAPVPGNGADSGNCMSDFSSVSLALPISCS